MYVSKQRFVPWWEHLQSADVVLRSQESLQMCAAGKLSQHISMLGEAQPSDNRETTRQKMKRVQVCLFAPPLY